MRAFDSDILSELFRGTAEYVQRAEAIPIEQQAVTIVVVEETLRGRLNVVRKAEAGKARVSLQRAYELLQDTIHYVEQFAILSYTDPAEHLYQSWRQQKLRVGTHDLRIAAICVAQGATLVSRNRRDFESVPGLSVEFWD